MNKRGDVSSFARGEPAAASAAVRRRQQAVEELRALVAEGEKGPFEPHLGMADIKAAGRERLKRSH